MERNQNQGTEQLGSQLGNQNFTQGDNHYQIESKVWNRLNPEERTSFNKAYGRLETRRTEIINSLGEDCRDNVESHFREIASTITSYVLQDLKQMV